MRRRTKLARGLGFATLVAISGGVLGNLAFSLLPGQAALPAGVFVVALIVALAAFWLSLWCLKRVADEALRSRARVASDPSEGRPVLIMGLSPLGRQEPDAIRADTARAKAGELGAQDVARSVREFMAFQKTASAEGRPTPAMTPWQQNIRVMWFHANARVPAARRLKKVLVLPSQQSKDQFALFKDYAEALFKGAVEIDFVHQDPGAGQHFCVRDLDGNEVRDYESYDYVRDGLEHAKSQAMVAWKYTDADICIDATPGQKPFSIAAAIMTLNTDVVFSYVTTAQLGSDRGGETRVYDAQIDVTGFSA